MDISDEIARDVLNKGLRGQDGTSSTYNDCTRHFRIVWGAVLKFTITFYYFNYGCWFDVSPNALIMPVCTI